MSNKIIALIVGILVCLVAGMFYFTYLQKQEMKSIGTLQATSTTAVNKYGITRVDGKYFFIDGVHTIVGEIPMPTLCDLLTAEAVVRESYPEKVSFNFSVINTAENCIQAVTAQRFVVSATATKAAVFDATFMGDTIDLNLVEAGPNETPESFNLYIKG